MIKQIFLCIYSITLSLQAVAQADSGQTSGERGAPEVVVSGHRTADPTQLSEAARKLVDVPGALGDPIAAVFSLPGVVYGSGDSGAPAVRGSSPDDNLFLVDFLPAGYVFHTFTTSVFSENIIQDFHLYPAGFGAQYANATGAVFDIALRKPRNESLNTVVDVSMLRSGLFLEGAISEHSAAYLSVRKSMIQLFIPKNEENNGVHLMQPPQDDDYQFKYVWDIGAYHSLTLAATGASDLAEADFGATSDLARVSPDLAGDARISNRFKNQSLIWDYFGDGGARGKLGFGHLRQDVVTRWGQGYFNDASLEQFLVKLKYDQPLTLRHTLHLGGELARNERAFVYDQVLVVCNEFDPTCGETRRGRVADDLTIRDISRELFITDTWRLTEGLSLNAGGQYQSNTYTRENFLNPRARLDWQFARHWTVTLKAGKYNRFPDLDAVLPKIGNPKLKSPRALHFTLGLERELDDGWSWSAEGYYKKFHDLPLALGTAEPDASRLYSNDVEGRAYGLDLLINRQRRDKWYGWLALSVAKSERTNARTGITKAYRLDTPFILNWVMNYQLRPRLNVGWRFSVRSGRESTPIVGIQQNPDFPGYVLPLYGEPFSERLPLYYRLDLRFGRDFVLGHHDSAVILDIINVLNTRNIEGRHLDYPRSQAEGALYLQDSVGMGLFPALSFRITF